MLEVVGQADAVNTPIATKLVEENPVDVEIVAANIETLGDTRFAHYLLAINSTETLNLTGLEATLARHGFVIRHRAKQGVKA